MGGACQEFCVVSHTNSRKGRSEYGEDEDYGVQRRNA
jgi:hypothetical protein